MASQESGTGWRVEFYTDRQRRQPAAEYIDSLPLDEQATIAREISVLRSLWLGEPIPHARHIGGTLWELKLGDNRLFYCTYIGRRLIVLHGYRKKTDKAPKQEIATAERYMADFFDREARKR